MDVVDDAALLLECALDVALCWEGFLELFA